MRKLMTVVVAAALGFGLSSCTTDAKVVDNNITQDADNFKVLRRVVFIDMRTGGYLLEVIGYCNINDQVHQIETICKDKGTYKKHLMGIQSEWVTYLAEQLDASNVSPNFYKYTVKPTTLLPLAEIR